MANVGGAAGAGGRENAAARHTKGTAIHVAASSCLRWRDFTVPTDTQRIYR
jgi:hypothetical protein